MMRIFGSHARDQAALLVVMHPGRDTQPLTQRRAGAVRRHDEIGRQGRALLHAHADRGSGDGNVVELRRAKQGNRGEGTQPFPQRGVYVARLDDVAQTGFADIGAVEMIVPCRRINPSFPGTGRHPGDDRFQTSIA
jgi:hypothetical protein